MKTIVLVKELPDGTWTWVCPDHPQQSGLGFPYDETMESAILHILDIHVSLAVRFRDDLDGRNSVPETPTATGTERVAQRHSARGVRQGRQATRGLD